MPKQSNRPKVLSWQPSLLALLGVLVTVSLCAFAQRTSVGHRQFSREQYENTLLRLDALVKSKDRPGIIKIGSETADQWERFGGDDYGRTMLEVSNILANYFADFRSSEAFSSRALAVADTLSLRLETRLLAFTKRDLNVGSGSEWVKERTVKTKQWLHAWERLEKGINRSFNFGERPRLNISPPNETGLPAGVSPNAIKDLRLRARYEAAIGANNKKALEFNRQTDLKYLDKIFTPEAEDYLVRVYSARPYELQALRRSLLLHGISKPVRLRILSRVTSNISQKPQ